ncbi:hypothetical protein TIFTF001_030301 [Ficus carica]|uniref:Uncharacterized protein n=1 Tax=Ficus carica TaxID=3494 RepID=A0AA88DT37_FICCA|nr:hypothetical protein TIFTF001_030301 [Ficus carica]
MRDFRPKNHAVKLVNRVETRGKPAGRDGWPELELASCAGLAENTARNYRGLGSYPADAHVKGTAGARVSGWRVDGRHMARRSWRLGSARQLAVGVA